ncbi:SDR family NAD(P)-dependent oxidoreductase [Actinomadura litoris]|uniref:SDR family NAD(P)-dependent oxidoreductase n=1 Tax=Actinomadura litoris TaxID=2678616 RepID=UPI001FA7BE95|nr:SDR family NAD(P)-dependent oxidoreductase [Actinomadura litoris]
MRTILITGGTDGIGRGLALHFLRNGDRVIAVGSTQAKGDRLLADAERLGAADRVVFHRTDLTLTRNCQELIDFVDASYPQLDALILGARHDRPFGPRLETEEGFERHLALLYLSRFVLAYGLAPALERAANPVIVSLCTPGVSAGAINWTDLNMTGKYSGFKASLQALRANDLLGVIFAEKRVGGKTRFVAYNPGVVATSMTDTLPMPVRPIAKAVFKVAAQPVDKALPPIVALVDTPPEQRFSASWKTKQVDLGKDTFDVDKAWRLFDATGQLLRTHKTGIAV